VLRVAVGPSIAGAIAGELDECLELPLVARKRVGIE
jgi:hypothetical protein